MKGSYIKTWFKIACRNLLKNGRRSIFTLIAIGMGFAAVNVFGGFSHYIFTGLRDGYIYGQGEGHLTIFKKGFRTKGKIEPTRYLINEDERNAIHKALMDHQEIILVTGQLYISGLLSNGDVSTIFIGVGRVPSAIQHIKNHASGMISRLKLSL